MNKILYFFGLIIFNLINYTLASPKSINPDFLNQNLHYLYKEVTFSPNFKSVSLKGPVFKGVHGFDPNSQSIYLSTSEYLKQLSWSQSVFPALSGGGKGHGTAFYIGKNLILTNKHVLQTDHRNLDCGLFTITTKIPLQEKITCKEVKYCSKKYDFCVAEMNNFSTGEPLDKYLPAFKLKKVKKENRGDSFYAIGNAVNFGIQGSKGNTIRLETINNYQVSDYKIMIHYIPTFGGSSGSPILSEDGDVVGINFAEKMYRYGRFQAEIGRSFHNYAVPSNVIIDELNNFDDSILNSGVNSGIKFTSTKKLESLVNTIQAKAYSKETLNKILESINKSKSIFSISKLDKKGTKFDGVKKNETNIPSSLNGFRVVLESFNEEVADKFIDYFNDKIIKNRNDVLKEKDQYISARDICINESGRFDGCVFERLFYKKFSTLLKKFSFTSSQALLIWNTLVSKANESNDKEFFIENKAIDLVLTKIVKKEITPLEFFSQCFLKESKRFKKLDYGFCNDNIANVLKDNNYQSVSDELVENVAKLFLKSKTHELILREFNYDVLDQDFQCLFYNKACERKNYKRLLKNWGFDLALKKSTLNKIIETLVEFHRR